MRTYVSTLGYHETRVNRPLLKHGLENDDVVVLVRPARDADSERGTDAVNYVEDMLHEIAPDADIVVERIDHTEFETAVIECSDIIQSAEGELIINFGGGAREIFLPLTVATILHAPSISSALQYTDIDQSVRQWSVPNLSAHVPSNTRETLAAVGQFGPKVPIAELHEELDISKSSVSRQITTLEDAALVETATAGKVKHATLTFAGRLKLRLIKDD